MNRGEVPGYEFEVPRGPRHASGPRHELGHDPRQFRRVEPEQRPRSEFGPDQLRQFRREPEPPPKSSVRTAGGVTSFDDAVSRARLYLKAGADAIFPEALETAEEFARFAKEVPAVLLANMTEFGKSPLLEFEELAQLGYKMVLYPLTAFRVAMRAARETLAEIRQVGHQRDEVPQMLTRAELYDLLGYAGYEERDRKYFG